MKIAIACDHGALALKNKVADHLTQKGHEVTDFGTYTLDSCDYPEYAAAAAKAVADGSHDRGIVLCTTGIGVSIAANKVDGIRCALLHSPGEVSHLVGCVREMKRRHPSGCLLFKFQF